MKNKEKYIGKIKEIAKECVENLTAEDIDYFRMHIDYSYHHFGYGLFLRNKYISRFRDDLEFEVFGCNFRDTLSANILMAIYTIIFPEFGTDISLVRDATDGDFSELNSQYNLKYKKNYAVDFPPAVYLNFEFKYNGKEDFNKCYNEYTGKIQKIVYLVAEKLWDFNVFKNRALELGYSEQEIKDTYTYCQKIFCEHHNFIPLEILYVKNPTNKSMSEFSLYKKQFEFLCSTDRFEINILPDYALVCKEIALIVVSCNGNLLENFIMFKNDSDVVKAAALNNASAIEYADDRFQQDREFIKFILKNSNYVGTVFYKGCYLKYIDDYEIVKIIIERAPFNFKYLSEKFRDDYELAKLSIGNKENCNPLFEYLSDRLKKDKSLALLQLSGCNPSVRGFTDEFLDDDEIGEFIANLEDGQYIITYMSKRVMSKYYDRFPERIQKSIRHYLDS